MSGPAPAPYWGKLPVSKVRRSSGGEDYSPSHSRTQSLDVTSHPQPKSNRTSLQTSHTDAPTDLSYSPLASPVASAFNPSGLAPRPSSQSYAHHESPLDVSGRRKRRSARNQDDLLDDTARATPPAAPDVPRAPPISYKNPYDNGRASPYTFTASGQPGPPPSALQRSMAQARATDADVDIHRKYPTERQFGATELVSSRQDLDEEEELAARRAARAANSGARGDVPRTHSRRQSSGMAFDDPNSSRKRGSQRQPFADDRSPLQKLELTLDSITKEEKRARVEAAERRAREKAAANAVANAAATAQPNTGRSVSQQGYQPGQQQVRFRNRGASVGQEDQRRVVVTDPVEAVPSSATKATNSHGPSPPRSQIPVPKNRNIPASEKSGLPQRKLSFRERAAKNDVNLTGGGDSTSTTSSPNTTPSGGIALTRNGSNKLKKNPPGDPWYGRRVEVEERFPTVNRRSDDPEEMLQASRWAGHNPQPFHDDDGQRHPARRKTYVEDEAEDDDDPMPVRVPAVDGIGVSRSVSLGPDGRPPPSTRPLPVPPKPATTKSVKFPDQAYGTPLHAEDDMDNPEHHRFRDFMHHENLQPGHGLYRPPTYLDEWKKGNVGTLAGKLLDITAEVPAPPEPSEPGTPDAPWWENKGGRRGSLSSRPKKAEAFDGEYDETQVPTRFKPPLHLKCGPLLRYCGLRHEKTPTRNNRNGTVVVKEIWRGSVMIVTQDAGSSYDIVPILRLFVQPIELLPPPPEELRGEQALLPEYVDPIAGIPKLGRKGETLYVRPVEHLEEAKDMSMLDPDDGLFEITRSAPDFDGTPDPPGSFAERRKRIQVDGEKLGKYRDVRGFRLHTERGCTFWRFNIEVELRDQQQRIAYRINRGPSLGFWVPGRDQAMNIMFHSCNGFSLSVKSDDFSGPDPMWRDVLNNHQTRPFHVMIGGGDQIYNDAIMRQTKHFQDWLLIKNPLHKHNAPFTPEMQDEVEEFYLERYSMWFSQGLFGLANSQIPMVNMYDDHDIIDGFGSYPHHFMKSPVFSGLGAVAFKYYMLFQHQSLMEETEQTEPSWVLGCKPGPYIQELSRSLFMLLGSGMALLAVDARTERTRDEVVREDTWKKIVDRCYAEIAKGQTKHLLVLLGVPIAYPRLVWLENILTSRLMDPVKALGKAGLLGNFLNNFDGGVEVLDDLDDHWTAKNHKEERKFVIEDLQDLAADKSVRVTILSGDVHLAAVGQFYSNPKLKLAKHKDFRYMPNIISSAIVNTPPPDLMADILNKRNKVHHFDKETDEDMIPIFNTGVDGKPRNNKRLLPHRNWCAIREYVPGSTPPATPPPEDSEYTLNATPAGSKSSIFRRLSFSSRNRGPAYRPDLPEEKDRSRPPMASGGGLFRSLSRRASLSDPEKRPGKLTRTLSLGRGDTAKSKAGFFGRRFSTSKKRDDGGINGSWGDDYSDEAMYDDYTPPSYPPPPPPHQQQQQQRRTRPTAMEGAGPSSDKLARMGLRGGAGQPAEFEVGDDSYFTARPPQRSYTQPAGHSRDYSLSPPPVDRERPRPFHRTPTGLSAKRLRKNPHRYQVDVEGGLEITLNVEVNARDPAGITMPYRLLVPRLEYEYQGEDPDDDDGEAVAAEGQEEYPYGDEAAVLDDDMEDAGIERGPYQAQQQQPQPKPARHGSIKRWFSGRRSNSMSEGGGGGDDDGGASRDHRWSEEETYGRQRPDPRQAAAAYSEYWNRPGHN
ncbi:hypothetical protein PG994_007555 [Apiospora phragmitis]|uniref:PhoD-like phosphatase domain-containing protein n=1 Tax=Apiospora phragmitis TaxID=2905665 RepID=A0ABR1V172_9PEZI